MGKVLSQFQHGFEGQISRAVDDIVISLKNGSEEDIPFGKPVFLMPGNNNCVQGYNSSSVSDASRFLGFAVRAADKIPDTVATQNTGSPAAYHPGDPVDILVRGSMVVATVTNAILGQPVYVRISDGKLTTAAGSAGTTILLPNVSVRGPRDGQNHMEIVVTGRNLL